MGNPITPLGKKSVKGGSRTALSHKKRELFLKKLAETGLVGESAKFVNLSIQTLNVYKKQDENFATKWQEALDAAFYAKIEPEAIRRGVEGVDEPIIWKGEIVGTKKTYSDAILLKLLQAWNRDKYGDNKKVQIEGGYGIAVIPAVPVDSDDWEKRAAELSKNQEGSMDAIVNNPGTVVDAEFEEVIPEEKEKNSEKRSQSGNNFTTIERT